MRFKDMNAEIRHSGRRALYLIRRTYALNRAEFARNRLPVELLYVKNTLDDAAGRKPTTDRLP